MRQPSESPGPDRSRAGYLRAAVVGPPAGTPLARAAQVSLQLLLVAAALAVVGFILVNLRLVILPVLAALFLATILMPPTDYLRRRGLPNALAALVAMVTALGLIAGAAALLAPPVAGELGELGESLREGIGEVGSSLEGIGVSQEDVDQAVDDGVQTLEDHSGAIGQGIVTGALLIVEIVAGILLTIVLLFFFLKDGERIWSFLVGLLPAQRRRDARELGRRSWTTLGQYLRGVALVALIDAVLIGTALAILGVPLVLPLAVLTFVAGFFPLVGAITAGAVAALVALVSNGVVTALIVVAVIVAIQQLEGDVVYPVVVGRQVRLHPVAILLGVTAGAVIAGIVGALFAVPTLAVGWTVYSYFRRERGPREVSPAPEG